MLERNDSQNLSLNKLNAVIAELEEQRLLYRFNMTTGAFLFLSALCSIGYSITYPSTHNDIVFYQATENIRDNNWVFNFSTSSGISCHDLFPYPFNDPCQLDLYNVNFSYDFMVFCAQLLFASCKSIIKANQDEPYFLYPLIGGFILLTLAAIPFACAVSKANKNDYLIRCHLTDLANELNIQFEKNDLTPQTLNITSIINILKAKRDELTPVTKLSESSGLLWKKPVIKEANQIDLAEIVDDNNTHEMNPLLV